MAVDSSEWQQATVDELNVRDVKSSVSQKMSHHENPKFPPLAPGPPRMFAPQSSMAVSRPKKNSTACLSCKTAKRKVGAGHAGLASGGFLPENWIG